MATLVEMVKGREVILEAQLGVIGGTMGLLTRFSLLSAIEIVYFLGRMLMGSHQNRVGPRVIMVQTNESTIHFRKNILIPQLGKRVNTM